MTSLEDHTETIDDLIAAGWSLTKIASKLTEDGCPTTRHSIRRLLEKRAESQGVDPKVRRTHDAPAEPGMTRDGDDIECRSDRVRHPITPEDLVTKKFKLSLDDVDIVHTTINVWDANVGDGEIAELYQTKVTLKLKRPIAAVIPARIDGIYIAPKRLVEARDVRTALFYGDQQCPFVDWDMFDAILKLTADQRPSLIFDPGDGRDFPSVSTHNTWPKWMAAAQKCIDTKYLCDRELRKANEDAEIIQELGNHDIRLANYMLKNAPAAYGLRPGSAEDEEELERVMSIRNLGRLDELNIQLVGDEEEAYDQARFMLSDQLGVEHGNKTGKDAAGKAGARKMFSLIIGHTHGQSHTHRTDYDHEGKPHVRVHIETGTGCLIDRGLGYAPNPDWVNGGYWVTMHKDGSFHAEPITFKNGYLYFRDKKY